VIFRVGIAMLLLNLDELRCLDMEETIQVSLTVEPFSRQLTHTVHMVYLSEQCKFTVRKW